MRLIMLESPEILRWQDWGLCEGTDNSSEAIFCRNVPYGKEGLLTVPQRGHLLAHAVDAQGCCWIMCKKKKKLPDEIKLCVCTRLKKRTIITMTERHVDTTREGYCVHLLQIIGSGERKWCSNYLTIQLHYEGRVECGAKLERGKEVP